MARLLVSVRSADEARAALKGGAAVIDVKEPSRGPLGRADVAVWSEVRRAVPAGTPVSLALGELREWIASPAFTERVDRFLPEYDPACYRGFSFRKVGLSGVADQWEEVWARFRAKWGVGPSWVAVIYADWKKAGAPEPARVLDAALASDDCGGVMIDTWDKSQHVPIDDTWKIWLDEARKAGRLTALAGSVDADRIERIRGLQPDIVAVRGAACIDGDRRKAVDPFRVAWLAEAAAQV
ncbi:MAG: (5-formylfuran-3-yl)methyl phosphate synthase [Isosphaeraceae bacterium]